MEQLVGWKFGLTTGLSIAYEECKQICATIYLIYMPQLFIFKVPSTYTRHSLLP